MARTLREHFVLDGVLGVSFLLAVIPALLGMFAVDLIVGHPGVTITVFLGLYIMSFAKVFSKLRQKTRK